jgi:signal peptidase II
LSDSTTEAKANSEVADAVRADSPGDVEGGREAPPSSIAGGAPRRPPQAYERELLAPPKDAAPFGTQPGSYHPSYVFLAIVSAVTLAIDVASKGWAAQRLDNYAAPVEVWKGHLAFVLAKNRGGAWGIMQTTSENVRRPFFLIVSVAAIFFILSLYRRLQPRQHTVRWGLPLVFGGALGNVIDRVRLGHVIDFIDAHAILGGVDQHWPTFNVADIAICVGVGLIVLDMFTSKRHAAVTAASPGVSPAPSGEPAADWPTETGRGETAHKKSDER